MRYVILDLEMNKIQKEYKEERKICNTEVIEFGAVMLDEQFKQISDFQTYVQPQYNQGIENVITQLTGITNKMVAKAPVFTEAFAQFTDWCNSFEGECQIQSWSTNDYYQIMREVKLKEYQLSDREEALLADWKDFQKEYMEKVGLSRCVSLGQALDYAGEIFQGRQHDAFDDAKNTAELFIIIRNDELFENRMHAVTEALRPTQFKSTLKDMFDFSAISSQLTL